MSELRELRRAIECGQREFAALLSVPLETLRTWDSGRRPVPVDVLLRATRAVSEHAKNSEPLSLDQLARELGVHQRTLRDAARAGRLRVTFSVRSVFRRPIRLATRPTVTRSYEHGTVTTDGEVRWPHRFLRCRKTTLSAWCGFDAGCDSPRPSSRTGSAPRTRRSSINGNHASARRRRCSGNASRHYRGQRRTRVVLGHRREGSSRRWRIPVPQQYRIIQAGRDGKPRNTRSHLINGEAG